MTELAVSSIEVAQKNLAIERDLLALTQSLLTTGLAPQQDLLRAEAQVRDAQSERDSALALIALYKSLGGGWPSASAEMSVSK
jgi:outer membrane protein TolC